MLHSISRFVFFSCVVLLLAPARAEPQKIFAVSHTQPNGAPEAVGAPSDTILFYDVSSIEAGAASDVFDNDPLFAVWVGYESFSGELEGTPTGQPFGDVESVVGLTFNHANGTLYASALDFGSPAFQDENTQEVFENTDQFGDNRGDFDLYRIDYQAILRDFNDNGRARGTVYATSTMPIDVSVEQDLANIGSPLFDQVVDGVANNVPHPSGAPMVWMDSAFEKIGELGRAQSPGSFFGYELDFVDPETLLTLDASTRSEPAGDHQIRLWKRTSTSPGAATISPNGADGLEGLIDAANADDNHEGGYNGQTTQSWESKILGRLELDSGGSSDPVGWSVVRQDGVLGIWVADSNGSRGDNVAFYEIDLSGPTPTATRSSLPGTPQGNVLEITDDPSTDLFSDDGSIDFLKVDTQGNVIMGETGFFEDPPVEAKAITIAIDSYTSGAVVPVGTDFSDNSTYAVSPNIDVSGAIDNDLATTNTTRVAYDKGSGLVYIVDQDPETDFIEDVYVFDPATGVIEYSEITTSTTPNDGPFNLGLVRTGTMVIFSRGDINDDGVTDADDLAPLAAAVADPTQGGVYSSAVGQEYFDLTGDGLLTDDDVAELQTLLGILPGDFNGDGSVSIADYTVWRDNLGSAAADALGYAGDGAPTVDAADYQLWKDNFGVTASSLEAFHGSQAPEPSAWAIGLLAAWIATIVRRGREPAIGVGGC